MRTPKIPPDRLYLPSHEWVRLQGDGTALIGLTHPLLERIGQIVSLELPALDDEMMLGVPFGSVEGMTALHELMPPFDALVLEVNEGMLWELDKLAADPYEEGWLLRLRIERPEQAAELMDAPAYAQHCKELWGKEVKVG